MRPNPIWRRLTRISLRGFILVFLVAAPLLAYLGNARQEYLREREALAALPNVLGIEPLFIWNGSATTPLLLNTFT